MSHGSWRPAVPKAGRKQEPCRDVKADDSGLGQTHKAQSSRFGLGDSSHPFMLMTRKEYDIPLCSLDVCIVTVSLSHRRWPGSLCPAPPSLSLEGLRSIPHTVGRTLPRVYYCHQVPGSGRCHHLVFLSHRRGRLPLPSRGRERLVLWQRDSGTNGCSALVTSIFLFLGGGVLTWKCTGTSINLSY